MNHCVPNRKLLHSDILPTFAGFIVSSPLKGAYTHFVYRDKDSKLFKMPKELFECKKKYNRKNTEILRIEQKLEFGDNIVFTANDQRIVLDYEKSIQVHETDCNDGKFLVKTLCVLPPSTDVDNVSRIWSKLFGFIDLEQRHPHDLDKAEELHAMAEHNVPIWSWVDIKIMPDEVLLPHFHSFIHDSIRPHDRVGIAVDERMIVWECDWNVNKPNRPNCGGKQHTWAITDSEGEEVVEKKEERLLDVRFRLEGVLIGKKELYCPEVKDRIYIGLWREEWCKKDDLPLGYKCSFDMYYSDIRQAYIAYYHNFYLDDEREEYYCDVWMPDNQTEPASITTQVYPTEMLGALYQTEFFGLIADRKRMLGNLPYMYCTHDDEFHATVEELQMEMPAERDISIRADGLLYYLSPNDGMGYFYSPRYATQKFLLNIEKAGMYPIGCWMEIEACYNAEENIHEIVRVKMWETTDLDVPCSKKGVSGAEFKVVGTLTNANGPFASGRLFSERYGLIADPEKKFKSQKRTKKYHLIVVWDSAEDALTLFKLVRMAEPNEKMSLNEKKGEKPSPMEPDNELGLELGVVDEEDEEPLNQVEYLRSAAIRLRQLRARERKRARDKQQKQCDEIVRQQCDREKLIAESEPGTSSQI